MHPVEEEMIRAVDAARYIGVKPATLACWRKRTRRTGEPVGPQGWVAISGTLVAYPASEIEKFLLAREQATKRRRLQAV